VLVQVQLLLLTYDMNKIFLWIKASLKLFFVVLLVCVFLTFIIFWIFEYPQILKFFFAKYQLYQDLSTFFQAYISKKSNLVIESQISSENVFIKTNQVNVVPSAQELSDRRYWLVVKWGWTLLFVGFCILVSRDDRPLEL
jgi:hypothetical protein